MNRQTGIIITVVVAVITLCCSAVCCMTGLAIALSKQLELDTGYTGEWYYGIPLICLAILVWLAPFLTWYFLVRGKQSTGEYLE